MIAAKPTTYKSARFRSRLEAKWAAFFDLCGWKWEYEPVDYAGWVPDFLLIMDRGTIPVEVKPIEWTTYEDGKEFVLHDKCLDKVRNYVMRTFKECLVFGAYPFPNEYNDCGIPCFATFIEYEPKDKDGNEVYVEEDIHRYDVVIHADSLLMARNRRRKPTEKINIYRPNDAFSEFHGKDSSRLSYDEMQEMWREAGRLTQWMAPA